MNKFIIIVQILIFTTILLSNSYEINNLTINKAYKIALKHNKNIKILKKEIEIKKENTKLNKLKFNPQIEIEFDDLYNSNDKNSLDSLNSGITFNKEIKRDKKVNININISKVEQDIKLTENQIFLNQLETDIRDKFIELSKIKELININKNMVEISEKFKKIANERYNIGKALLVELNKAELDLLNNNLLYNNLLSKYEIKKSELKTIIGSKNFSFKNIKFDFFKISNKIFNNKIDDKNQYIILAKLKTKFNNLKLKYENSYKNRNFNFKSRYNYSKADKSNSLSFGFEFPIFISNNKINQINISKLEFDISNLELEQLIFKLNSKIFELNRWLKTNYNKSIIIKNKILPKAKENLDMIINGYKLGKFSYIELLDAKKSFFEAKSEYINEIVEYHFIVSKLILLNK